VKRVERGNPEIPENPYLLLTPGPLSTAPGVRGAMLRDWCTWDEDYKALVQDVRRRLLDIAGVSPATHTAVLMQGSGTFAVEAAIGTAVPPGGRLYVLANGSYGLRMVEIARRAGIDVAFQCESEMEPPDLELFRRELERDPAITHVAVVHSETTTGMLNPIEEIVSMAKEYGKVCIVDAMSSFGGVPLDLRCLGADYLVSSANKCIQGVPGFGFVIAGVDELRQCEGRSRSLSLDLYDQWRVMEADRGKWRFTSPTHVVHAFSRALRDLEEEGGVAARHARYVANQRTLAVGMRALGFEPLLPEEWQGPIITTFRYPPGSAFEFVRFYTLLKERGFVIYPGKITRIETFRVGTIGDIGPEDVARFLAAVEESRSRLAV
jgi:2-aminoethylphosphonate-pyruvate transaminase